MKCIKTSLLLFFIVGTAFAQKPDKALVRVKYALSHMTDTNQRDNFYKETMMLIAGKDASVYLSYDGMTKDIEAKKSLEQQVKEQNGNITSITMPRSTRIVNPIQHYYFAKDDKFITHERIGVIYETEQSPEKINWKITNETLTLEGIQCKKAFADFKGRKWTAWFAEELPFISGPWKLIGLPGLILQAHDENKEVMFDFAGMEKVEEPMVKQVIDPNDKFAIRNIGSSGFLTETEIKLPTSNVVKTTFEDLDRLKKVRAADPQGFAKAQLASMGMNMSPTVSSRNQANQAKKTIFNNPIDKTKN